jgi:putative endonuclease
VASLDQPEAYYVYLARCRNGTFYVGYTRDVPRRIAAHNAGQGGHYTRANRPLSLVATWAFSSQREAMRAERELKRLSHAKKLALAEFKRTLSGEGYERQTPSNPPDHL